VAVVEKLIEKNVRVLMIVEIVFDASSAAVEIHAEPF
jgi:hypothetical protein